MLKPAQLAPICMRLVVISIISSLLYNFVGRMKDGTHRYFAHKSFKCAPWLVQVMAFTIAETELGLLFMWIFQAVQFGCTEGMADLAPRMLKLVGPGAPRNEQLRTKYESDISWLDIPANFLIFFGSIAM
ncbi:hypothetical protein B484DRAFT_404758 [Ochromonadaceae sp. CCMP2298]|nr:hypothetical protein B484DRAFT_404758 [Ochromonadaceae sp. CCMP2298]